MRGSIYTRIKCPKCGKSLKFNPKADTLNCPQHPGIEHYGACFVRFGQNINKSFPSVSQAVRFLNGVRFEVDRNVYDEKDYSQVNYYSFSHLADKYLKSKEKLNSYKNIKNYINKAKNYFGDKNVKEFKKIDFINFLDTLDVTPKTKHNYITQIRNFFNFLTEDLEIIEESQKPRFPKIKFDSKYRNIVDYDTQQAIIEKVKEMSWHINPKIYLGIRILSYSVNIRPGDLLKIKEGDIDINGKRIVIENPTKSQLLKQKWRIVFLLDEEVELIQDLMGQYPAHPDMPFFRHHSPYNNLKVNDVFGAAYFRKWWTRACGEIGIDKTVELYAGTRHSTVTAIANKFGTDTARKSTQHRTNTAFDRYCQAIDQTGIELARRMEDEKESKKVIPLHKISGK
ncbi:MAG: site-specific integrase [Thermodesulfobacteriota bacterium]|nr:site-specific integrase [Thermodesulfobacteriota bacterium]